MKMAENTFGAAKDYFIEKLSDTYPEEEVNAFFYRSMEHLFNLEKSELLLRKNDRIGESDLVRIVNTVKALAQQTPIQYIFNSAHFYGLELYVDSSVLIPRPETEELVDWIIKGKAIVPKSIIDVGTGSGCIALALKTAFPSAMVKAIDVSSKALEVAKRNANSLDLAIELLELNILHQDLEEKNTVDILVSNPPYVLKSEAAQMRSNVLEHEPHLALFVPDNDALIFHHRIATVALLALKKGGRLFFEINEAYGDEVCQLLTDMGYRNVELRKDLNGRNRLIKGEK